MLIAVSTGLLSSDVRIKSVSVHFHSLSFVYLDVRAAFFSQSGLGAVFPCQAYVCGW